jgi:hypothetical protein
VISLLILISLLCLDDILHVILVQFWANFETRIDTSMTILLAVSALVSAARVPGKLHLSLSVLVVSVAFWAFVLLISDYMCTHTDFTILCISLPVQYVVILGSIPQVGYLTDFDVWIFNMFIMLAACVFAHQLVVNSFRKVEQWPFRAVAIRLVEMTGRVLIIPLCLYMFGQTFEGDELSFFGSLTLQISMGILFFLLMIREAYGVKKAVRNGLILILEKIEGGKRKLSWWELFVVNICYFKVFDLTTAPYKAKLKRMKRMNAGNNGDMELSAVQNTLHAEEVTGSSDHDRRRRRRVSLSREPGESLSDPSLLSRVRSKSLYDSDDEM